MCTGRECREPHRQMQRLKPGFELCESRNCLVHPGSPGLAEVCQRCWSTEIFVEYVTHEERAAKLIRTAFQAHAATWRPVTTARTRPLSGLRYLPNILPSSQSCDDAEMRARPVGRPSTGCCVCVCVCPRMLAPVPCAPEPGLEMVTTSSTMWSSFWEHFLWARHRMQSSECFTGTILHFRKAHEMGETEEIIVPIL